MASLPPGCLCPNYAHSFLGLLVRRYDLLLLCIYCLFLVYTKAILHYDTVYIHYHKLFFRIALDRVGACALLLLLLLVLGGRAHVVCMLIALEEEDDEGGWEEEFYQRS